MLVTSLFIDERLTFSFLAIDAISGMTSMVLLHHPYSTNWVRPSYTYFTLSDFQ